MSSPGASRRFSRASRVSSMFGDGDFFSRYTLRFLDPVLEDDFRMALALQLKPAIRLMLPVVMIGAAAMLLTLNETLSERHWAPSHDLSVVVLGISMSFGVVLTLISLFRVPFWMRNFHPITLAAASMVLLTVTLNGLMVGEVDQMYVVLTAAAALGIAPSILPFVELMVFNSFCLTLVVVPIWLSDATGQPLSTRASAVFILFLEYVVVAVFAYHSAMGRRELFLLRRRLERENRKLHTRLREFESLSTSNVDMDGPIVKVVSALQTLRVKHGADEEDRDKLSMALAVIVQRDMFNTRIADNVQTDGETKAYLSAELGQRRGTLRRRSILPNRRRISKLAETPTVPLLLPDEEAKLSELLGRLDQWSLDIFQIAELSNGRPLQVVGMRVFEQLGLLERFKIDAVVLRAFLGKIEAGYNKVPYHTSTHAADVLHGVYYLCRNEVAKRYLSDVDVLALAIAAVIHDYQHPGINNNFLIATGHELAMLYNDRSVLENHHAASAFAAMAAEPNINILRDMEEDERKTVRRLVIEFVLATDFSKHFEILNQFKGKLSGDGLSDIDPDDALLLCKVLIKMADISNVTKGPELSRKWADAVMAEFWAQGDKEREAGLPVSTFFDRREPLVAKCQSSFIGFLVRPLAAPVFELLEEPGLLQQVDENKRDWDRKLGP